MNSKTLWAVIIIVVLAGAAYWYTNSKASSAQNGARVPDTTAATGAQMPSRDPVVNGTWKSTDDPKFTRTFRADGTITDAYAGDASATETGTFVVVDPAKEAVGVPVDTVLGMTVLKVTFPKSGVLYFGVKNETESSLQLIYLGRGNILSFTKVQ